MNDESVTAREGEPGVGAGAWGVVIIFVVVKVDDFEIMSFGLLDFS